MKSKIITAVAAALVAGIAGLTLATGASAAPFKLNLSGLCPAVNGGSINGGNQTKWSGWKNYPCAQVIISTSYSRSVKGFGHARFLRYKDKFASISNIRKCRKSVLIVRLYKRSGGTWKLVQTRRARAVAALQGVFIKRCSVEVATSYTNGGLQYRTIVFAVDGGGGTKGVSMAAAVRSKNW